MTKAVQRRRGTASEHQTFTGLEGEITVNTTNNSVHVHDGSTAGGFELARADGSNITEEALTALGLDGLNRSTANLSWNSSSDTYTSNTTQSSVTKVHQNMKRCILRADGTVNYYLDPTDSTKKLDGTSANIDGSDGNVMVEIPRFYFRQTKSGTTTTWEISDIPLAGYSLHLHFLRTAKL